MEIQIKNITKIIKGKYVIDNISVNFESGKIYGLRGINGSGKTMLLRLLAGLIYANSGDILVDGYKLSKDIDFPKNMGILIENPAFLDTYSGYMNLKLLTSIQGKVKDSQIYKTLERVGLEPHNKKKYKKYSLGMKQRLGIAAAIVEKPNLLLLDEPTNALDTDGVEILKNIIKTEKRRGTLIIMTCHDPVILEELSDEIILLENGKIKEDIHEKS